MLRVCVIGMGPIGNRHCRIYKKEPLVGARGRVRQAPEDRAQAGGAKRTGFRTSWTPREMLRELKPDLVSVTTGGYEYSAPTTTNRPCKRFDSGCHVLCEKPISNTIDARARNGRNCEAPEPLLRPGLQPPLHRRRALSPKSGRDEGRLGDLAVLQHGTVDRKAGGLPLPLLPLKGAQIRTPSRSCATLWAISRPCNASR